MTVVKPTSAQRENHKPSRAVGLRRKWLLRGVGPACVVGVFLGASLWRRSESLGWGILCAVGFAVATHSLYFALAHRRRAMWLRDDGSPRCTKCRYPIEADYAVCPECGLALTPETVEASRYVWMDRRRFTIMVVLAAIAYTAAILALIQLLSTM